MNKIKLLKASPFYHNVLKEVYLRAPLLHTQSYSIQYREIMDTLFGWSDFWKINLEKMGHYEVEEIITNNELMQKKWADEHKIKYSSENWLLDILEAQILHFKPDIFFAHDYHNITPDFIKRTKKKCPNIKLTIGWDGIAKNDITLFSECDLILSCVPYVCDFYKKHGFKYLCLPFSFETTILNKLNSSSIKVHDFSFIGSLIQGNEMHNQRRQTISELISKTQLKVWSPDINENWKWYKYSQRQRLLKGQWNDYWQIIRIGKGWQGEAFGINMYKILTDSKITFNSHIDIAKNTAANMRLWEATGVGTCLVTDWKENLKDIFVPDVEIVTYKSPGECIEKVNYLLNNDVEREKIAKAGQKRTLEHYSFYNRMLEFHNYLKPYYGK